MKEAFVEILSKANLILEDINQEISQSDDPQTQNRMEATKETVEDMIRLINQEA